MGWPVAWLKEMVSADEFDDWCRYHARYPLDDQSNHHFPIASLEAALINVNRREGTRAVSLFDRLIFQKNKERSIDEDLASDDW